jgi:hypothetical protein
MRTSTFTGYALALLMAGSGAALAQSTSPWPDPPAAAQSSAPAAKPPTAPATIAPKKPAAPKAAATAKPAKPKTAAKPKAKTAAKPAAAPAAPAFSPTPEQMAGINFTCSRDTRELCKEASGGSPEVYACLQRNTGKLSADCRTSVMAVEESAAEEVDPDAGAPAATPPPAKPAPKKRK